MQLGFLKRTPRGRMATARAYDHMGYTPNGVTSDQNPLF
jgi:Holliday junction DNA helicase RuvB